MRISFLLEALKSFLLIHIALYLLNQIMNHVLRKYQFHPANFRNIVVIRNIFANGNSYINIGLFFSKIFSKNTSYYINYAIKTIRNKS